MRVVMFAALYGILALAAGQVDGAWTWRSLDNPNGLASAGTYANGVSNGTVVGMYYDVQATNHCGFSYDGTSWNRLIYPGAVHTEAQGIWGSTIVGTYSSGTGYYGFTYDGTAWQTLDYPDHSSTTYVTQVRIGDGGKIIGDYTTDGSSSTHGAIYDGTNWNTLDYPGAYATDLTGIYGSTVIAAYMMKSPLDGGSWAGALYDGVMWHAFDYPGTSQRTIPLGISGNNIVGYYLDSAQKPIGFLYNGATWTSFEYPSLGVRETMPMAIDGNVIVGVYNAGGPTHGFMLTVPEPATLFLLALGGLLTARRRRV